MVDIDGVGVDDDGVDGDRAKRRVERRAGWLTCEASSTTHTPNPRTHSLTFLCLVVGVYHHIWVFFFTCV